MTLVSGGHCSVYDHGMKHALGGNAVTFVNRDGSTTFVCVYLAHSKSMEDIVSSLHMFTGHAAVKRFYSGNADELASEPRLLNIPHEASQQGAPQTNGNIERDAPDMLAGARTLLVAVGLRGFVGRWPHLAMCTSITASRTPIEDPLLGFKGTVRKRRGG